MLQNAIFCDDILKKPSASGGIAPTPLPGALPLDPTGGLLRPPDPRIIFLLFHFCPVPCLFQSCSISVMFPPSGFRWALGLFFSPGPGFCTETQGCCIFTPGFCVGLAVFSRCLLLRAPLGGAYSPSRHLGRVLRTLGRLGQMVFGPFGPAPWTFFVDLANFLAFLSCEKGLSASSVKVHRSAVCTTIRQMGGPSFSDDPLLRDLVRGAALAEAKSPHRTPSWDLFLVLLALRLPPYEPLKQSSLKHLTLKMTFLVSLASGRRCSEVHTLSELPSDVAFEPDGSMSLQFLPDFLAKNQLPGSPSPIVSIKSLTSILAPDDEDRLLCPVRALRAYRKRTESFRSKRSCLLLLEQEL